MKIARLKKVQKNLAFFANNYKFREPYQVLIDGTFAFAALENKFNIQDQIPKYFQAETKLLTTPCVIMETEKLGPKVHGAMLIIKRFAVHKCSHIKNPTTGSKCLRSMIGKENENRYIIATQDRELQEKLRLVPGVPLMYLHGHAPTLEPPSIASKNKAHELMKNIGMTPIQLETLKELKQKSGIVEEKIIPKKKRKKGGPNPLSCKKKLKKPIINESSKNSGKVRKRKRIKIPSHVKEALKAS